MNNQTPIFRRSRHDWLTPLQAAVATLFTLTSLCGAAEPNQRLKVSDNHHFLVYQDGRPFFYLGDTAWELFHRLNREDAQKYLVKRANQGFTVIQAVAIGELDGHEASNAYGYLPLVNLDPSRPAIADGPDNDYWDHVDFIVNKAESLGLFIGFLPTWGRYWHDPVKDGKPLFNSDNAEKYGRWLGTRYKDKPIIWILGGDRPVENDAQKAAIEALAHGLRRGDGGSHLITFHPPGGGGSSQWFQDSPWLDFNMRQNGHQAEFEGTYSKTRVDYNRTPIKPVIDGEPIYEDHPVSFDAQRFGHSIAADIRRPLYWDLFSGACGHTYGHHSVWQMWQEGRPPINNPLMPWFEALDQPGAGQVKYARLLMESRPILSRIPDDSLIVTAKVPTAVPGAGRNRFTATRDISGSYVMVYAPIGRKFSVRLDKLSGAKIRAWWFNPRNGEATEIGEFAKTDDKEFITPTPGEALDWILVLDDVSRQFGPPGKH
jgi:hypothetical protein